MQRSPTLNLSTLGLVLITSLMLLPILVVGSALFDPFADIWQHLSEFVLPRVAKNTLILLVMVGIGAGTLGTLLAWVTSVYDFPFRRFFRWALMLPLAIPAYVLAFVSVGFLDYTGVVQTTLRSFGITSGVPSLNNVWAAGIILSFAFYPYVYLLARAAFISQGKRSLEAGAMLGFTHRQCFYKIALPQARPWIIGGILLALMEVLADFGAVSVFNVDTFTTAIYKAWFSLFSLTTAAQLSAMLVFVVFFVLLFEQYWQSKRSYTQKTNSKRSSFIPVSRPKAIGITLFCASVFIVSFVIPVIQLVYWTSQSWQIDLDARYIGFVWNTITIASITAVIVALIGMFLSWVKRQQSKQHSNKHSGKHALATKALISLATLGYAVPGTVLAVGAFIPIAWLDNLLIELSITHAQALAGSVMVMLVALSIRFLAVAFSPIDRQLQRLSSSQEHAANLLTERKLTRWQRVYLPTLRPGVLSALLIAFVEVTKEMPITLMTRRDGWDTLAVRIYQMTAEGMWERAAMPSLFIILVGLVPVWLLIRESER